MSDSQESFTSSDEEIHATHGSPGHVAPLPVPITTATSPEPVVVYEVAPEPHIIEWHGAALSELDAHALGNDDEDSENDDDNDEKDLHALFDDMPDAPSTEVDKLRSLLEGFCRGILYSPHLSNEQKMEKLQSLLKPGEQAKLIDLLEVSIAQAQAVTQDLVESYTEQLQTAPESTQTPTPLYHGIVDMPMMDEPVTIESTLKPGTTYSGTAASFRNKICQALAQFAVSTQDLDTFRSNVGTAVDMEAQVEMGILAFEYMADDDLVKLKQQWSMQLDDIITAVWEACQNLDAVPEKADDVQTLEAYPVLCELTLLLGHLQTINIIQQRRQDDEAHAEAEAHAAVPAALAPAYAETP